MKKTALSFRIDEEKVEAVDQLAEVIQLPRSAIINQAIDMYLDVQRWQIEHIRKAIKEADKGKFVSKKSFESRKKKWLK
jgi:predicted transcriptional regulator